MIDKSFGGFVRENLALLDELGRRYAEYRVEVSQSYLDELLAKIRLRTPAGYWFSGSWRVSSTGEQVCGWSRELELSGTKSTATVGFGFNIEPVHLSSGWWPFMNNCCWTGVRLWLPPQVLNEVLASAQRLDLISEPPDDNWILWRSWEPLAATTVEGLHDRLIGDDRTANQDEIVEMLAQWKADLEKVLAQLAQDA